MAHKIAKKHWSEVALTKAGVPITPTLIAEALAGYWEAFPKGHTGHKKTYLPFSQYPNGWKEGAHVGYFEKYSGVKDLHFAPANAEIGEQLRHVDITLRQKKTGKRLMSLEATAISDGRTGWFALACINLLQRGRHGIEVFLFGAGRVAEAIILSLNDGAGERIKSVAVLNHHGKSNHQLVEKLRSKVEFSLVAVDDRKLLPTAGFVITATSANGPVFKIEEIAPNAVTLALGVDELPTDYFPLLLKAGGIIVADDMEAMESFNLDSLALYYSRNNLKLTENGKNDGVRNYADVLTNTTLMEKIETWDGPASFSAVGLASLDLAVAAHVYETLMLKHSRKAALRRIGFVRIISSRASHCFCPWSA